ncbi:MAG: CO dehydrogenase maturation factor, partial [Methanosaeta sp. ASP1-1]
LGKGIGIERYFAVINKADNPGPVADKLAAMGIPVLGTIPFDKCLVEADLAGKPPIDFNCPAVDSIKAIKIKLEELFGEKKQ